MEEYSRKAIREWFAINYGTCLSKKTGLIAIENKPHFKTGNPKKLIQTYKGNEVNVLPSAALEYAKQQSNENITSRDVVDVVNCMLIDYSLKNKLKAGTGRGEILCKNAAIFFNNNCPKEKADELMKRLIVIQRTGDISWIGWVRRGHKSDFSCGELRQWLRTSQPDVEQLTCWKCRWQK